MNDYDAKLCVIQAVKVWEARRLARAYTRQREATSELHRIVKRWMRVYIQRHGWGVMNSEVMTFEFRECMNKIISSAYRKGLHRNTSVGSNRIISLMLRFQYGQI